MIPYLLSIIKHVQYPLPCSVTQYLCEYIRQVGLGVFLGSVTNEVRNSLSVFMICDAVVFLRNTDYGLDVFLNTASLSQNMPLGPLSGTPNMRSFYCSTITNLTANLSGVNSDLKVGVLTELCFLLSHITGAWLQNINMHV